MAPESARTPRARKVHPDKIRRLYASDAQGLLDRELLDDVGYGIYARCVDVLESSRAQSAPYDALPVYKTFVDQWPLAKTAQEKMLLVDRVIHEFHIHYRGVGTPIGCDIVKATEKEMVELLAGLAYGSGSTEGLNETRALWEATLKAKQLNRTRSDLVVVARNLGIKGASGMRKRRLIDEIERVEPDFFAPLLSLIRGAVAQSEDG